MKEIRPLAEFLKEFRSLPKAYLCICEEPVKLGERLYFTTEEVALSVMISSYRDSASTGYNSDIDASLLAAFNGEVEGEDGPISLSVKPLPPLPTVTIQKRKYLAGIATKNTSGIAEIWVSEAT